MIVHILLGKPREDLSEDERQQLGRTIAGLIRVPSVLDMTWGIDFSGRGKGYTHAAVMHFADRDGLQAYQEDELHRETVEILNRLMPDRLILDYETATSGISA